MSAQLVGAAGLGLIAVNAWTGPQRAKLSAVTGGTGSTDDAHTAVKQLGAELLGVGVLVLLAQTSDKAAGAALAALGSLWLVWFLTRHGSGGTAGATHPTPANPTRSA